MSWCLLVISCLFPFVFVFSYPGWGGYTCGAEKFARVQRAFRAKATKKTDTSGDPRWQGRDAAHWLQGKYLHIHVQHKTFQLSFYVLMCTRWMTGTECTSSVRGILFSESPWPWICLNSGLYSTAYMLHIQQRRTIGVINGMTYS